MLLFYDARVHKLISTLALGFAHFVCSGCKRWFCFAKQKKNVENLYSHSVQGIEMPFIKTCFHIAHENCWKEYYTELGGEDQVHCV